MNKNQKLQNVGSILQHNELKIIITETSLLQDGGLNNH